MHCPFCRHPDSRVVDSRTTDDGTAIRRRRQCPECDRRFTTVEQVTLAVVKRCGVTEPFSREKIIAGVRKASDMVDRRNGPNRATRLLRQGADTAESLFGRKKRRRF